jgi:hypothetical protein
MRLLAMPAAQAVKGAAIGNVLSTLVGIPLMWMGLATLQLSLAGTAHGLATPTTRLYAVTVQAPWLIPYEEDLSWMIPAALLVLGLPAYLLSVLIEWQAVLPFLSPSHRAGTLRAVALANVASYLLLALLFFLVLRTQALSSPVFAVLEPASTWLMESVFALLQSIQGPSAK